MIRGKILSVSTTGFVLCKGYWIKDAIGKYKVVDRLFAPFSRFFLTRRLLRAEITGLYTLNNGNRVAIAKKGLFLQKKDSASFIKCFSLPHGSKPLNLCITPSGNIYLGEYFQNKTKRAVNIFISTDNALSWHIAYTFKVGEINHIHGLFHDPYTDRIWVTTGDRNNECIIGYTADEFSSFKEVFRGGQEYRTCQLFFYRDFIVFGTDSQYEHNVLKCFDRESLEILELQKVQGSIIKGGQVGNIAFISTTVEPSKVNKDRYAHLWVTKDGFHWEERLKAKKDCWPSLFQYGTFVFPVYETESIVNLYFSGRALRAFDGKTSYIAL